MVPITVSLKSKRKFKGPSIRSTDVRFADRRRDLGETFGTKKAKKAISNQDRNMIDSSKLESIEDSIIDAIKASTENLPSSEEVKENISSDRPIPFYDLETTEVENIYSINSIIPKAEFNFIRVDSILNEPLLEDKLKLLPFSSSRYIKNKLSGIKDKSQTQKLKMIYYASLLLGIRANYRITNKHAMLVKLGNPPDILIDGIIDRFASFKPGAYGKIKERGFTIDPNSEDKLLCYLLALLLKLENYKLEITPMASELGLKPSKLIDLCKALGCTIRYANLSEAEALGLNKNQVNRYRIAVLKAPLKLPEVVKRGRRTNGR